MPKVSKTKKPLGRPKIYTEEFLAKKAKEFLQWSKKDDALVLAEWYSDVDVGYDTISDWEQLSGTFSQAKRVVKARIGARREKLALQGKLDSGIVRKSMALYDPSMKAYEMELKGIDKASAQEALRTVVRGCMDQKKESPYQDQVEKN